MNRIKHGDKYLFIDDFITCFCVDGPEGLVLKVESLPWAKQKRIVNEVLTQTLEFANKGYWQDLNSWYEKKQILNGRPKKLPKINERRYYKSTNINDSRHTYLRIPVNLYSLEGGDVFRVVFEKKKITITKTEGDSYEQ
tara:strand:- start:1514 stop:1930 length:417 start_codon:yes stop_codon:yes gene_type:complete